MTVVVRILFLVWLLCGASVLAAQEIQSLASDPEQFFSNWEEVASSAEQTVDDPDSTIAQLEELRSGIVDFRSTFSAARGANADRITALENQLEALGPVPEGGVESEEVAATRAELEGRLEELRAPARVSEAAFRRSESLINEIDTIIRERQARRLLFLGPSPLDLRNLPVVAQDLRRVFNEAAAETYGLTQRMTNRQIVDRLPLFVVLIVSGAILMLKGKTWAQHGIEYMRRFGGRGYGVWTFLVSLLRIFIPLSGLMLVTSAIRMTGVLGDIIENLLAALPLAAFVILGFRWISERLFAVEDDEALIALTQSKRRSARFYMSVLAMLFAFRIFLESLFALEGATPETIAFLNFPIVGVMGAILIFFGGAIRKIKKSEGERNEDDETPEHASNLVRFLRICGGAMIGIGAIAPTMAAIGYAEAGNALLYPAVVSLLLMGLVLIFQRFFVDVYGLVTGQGEAARDGLMAILFWTVLFIAALPVFALIWGARVTDLTELWTQFLLGFEIGGTRIAPSNFIAFAVIFSIGYGVTRLVQGTLRAQVLPKTRIDVGGQNAIVSGFGYVGLTLAALIAVTGAGLDLSGFAIVAGALSVGIGFGLQTIVSNFVSGIILLIERPISEGDWIEVGGQMGYVRDISVRSTRIETFDRTDVIVPNSDLISGTVTNYTRGNTIGRLIVSVGVAYGTDTQKVDEILHEIALAQPMVMRKPPPNVFFMGFGADSLDFEIRAILRDVNWILSVKNDINHEIARRFAEEGIEIPFAQRDVWLRNPESLQTKTATDE